MKFTVREGFVVAYTDRIKQGDKTVEREYSFYPEDGAVELDKSHATQHAHKLEGVDKDGKAFLEGLVLPPSPLAAGAAPLDVSAVIAAAVQAGLAAGTAAAQAKAPA